MGSLIVKFARVGISRPADIAREFDHGHLHSQADPEVGDTVLARIARGRDFSLTPAVPEASRNQDAIRLVQEPFNPHLFDLFRLNTIQLYSSVVGDPAVDQRLHQTFVRLLEAHIFSHNGDPDGFLGVLENLSGPLPFSEIGRAGPYMELFHDFFIQPLLVKDQRDLVDPFDVLSGNDGVFFYVTKMGDLGF